MPKYVIVGNSAGGIAATETIREVDPRGSITVVSEEPYPAYSRPAIAEFLMGERTFDERMLFRDKEFYSRNRVETRLGTKALQLNVPGRTVALDNGENLPFERLLLATGGTPIMPPMPGLDLRGVHTFVTLDDARRLLQAMREGAERVVVVGGGLIGCSLTHALLRRGGVQVTMVELRERILTSMMDAAASQRMEARLQELGVRLLTGRSVARVLPDAKATGVGGVLLDNGEEVPCDLVGMAVGVRPRVELAQGTPIRVGRGFLVDQYMETSVPGIYACGDAVEAHDFIYKAPRVVAIWPNAFIGGRIAGFNMAGAPAQYDGCTAMNALSYFDLALASGGMFDPAPEDGCTILSKEAGAVYRKAIIKGNRLVGFVLLEDIEQAGVLYRLMQEQVDVSRFQEHLVADNFGLVRLPRHLRQAWLFGNGRPPQPMSTPAGHSSRVMG
ncbi:MAG: NAD(P)/FAD-dependent oxidoreductase [Chloroflexi bacterium]|nr:NAD(P)/FAD-dependent oxidoreductase [Chloroflexota bacterium]